ncbi:MAG: hypothetical protein OEV38_20450, partial [Nitrospira sp.]|nr:hypothetical protein [Nitrospira sp.]
RASSMSITMPGIMPDSAQPPLRLISRWKYDPASDSFHIGRGYRLTPVMNRIKVNLDVLSSLTFPSLAPLLSHRLCASDSSVFAASTPEPP